MSKFADLTSHHIEGIARMGNKAFSVPLFSQIDDTLWTGGCPVDEVPEEFQFVVCLYPWEPYKVPETTTFLSARLYDSHDMPNEQMLATLADFVNGCRKIGATLVHCQAGLNRSALVAGLALIRSGVKPADAIALLREKRCDAVLCNQAFEKWLLGRKP